MTNIASIDLGSHTARLLVSQRREPPGSIRPIIRRRAYIRLAEDFDDQGERNIKQEAIDRTLNALEDFVSVIRAYNVEVIQAVSTGVVRKAANREHFLNLIFDRTGIKVNLISGEEEARLTGKGVLHSLGIRDGPFLIFDLGGGSTEFIAGNGRVDLVRSIPLGAVILSQRYLGNDPPDEESLKVLEEHVDEVLRKAFPPQSYQQDRLLVGTGGTVTTLAAMVNDIPVEEISPERMNGLVLDRGGLEAVFKKMTRLRVEERVKLPGLDRGRADVIPAGSMVVIRIMHHFNTRKMMVSLSDLLEGILIDGLEA